MFFNGVSRFYPFLSHETNSVTAESICRERIGFGVIASCGQVKKWPGAISGIHIASFQA